MKRFLIIAVLALGCSDAVRVSAATGRLICGALGCPCASAGRLTSGGAIAVDLLPDGGVRPVYARGGAP